MPNDGPSEAVEPGGESLDDPAPPVSTHAAAVVGSRLGGAVGAGRGQQLDADTRERGSQFVGVVRLVGDDAHRPTGRIIARQLCAFAAGDVPAFLNHLHPRVRWNEAESNPLADGNPYVGAEAILNGVFVRLAGDFADFRVQTDEFFGGGGVVTMLGRYHARSIATGKALDVQVQHTWWLDGGKVVRFQQMVDTAKLLATLV